MDYRKVYEQWVTDPFFDEKTRKELEEIRGQNEEIEDRFYQELQFGTAGLRGKLGAGTNRMNDYTVAKATEGFARMIDTYGDEAKKKGVAIAYDVRHKSDHFSELAARIFAAHGIKVYIYRETMPTPVLSYTIRKLDTFAGVMVTASHNPREYNGYKAYNGDGSQILDDWAGAIMKNIAEITDYSVIKMIDFDDGLSDGIIEYVPESVYADYLDDIETLGLHDEKVDKEIRVVYTPLNGSGNIPVRDILKRRGFTNIFLVKEQVEPDPDFTTIGYPNPEVPAVFEYAEKLGKEKDADLLLATDPDSDRLAVEVKDENGEYVFLNGNKIGSLFVYYILSQLKAKNALPENGAVIKSIVTGNMAEAIAEDFGVKSFDVLTGFKNIAAPVNEWDETGEYTFLFGFEESIGYNRAPFVRDKDAVSSSMLMVEMAGFYKQEGKTLLDVLEEMFQKYGYYNEKVISVVLEGADGREKIARIMEDFRHNPLKEVKDLHLASKIDYQNDDTGLPKTNALKYVYDDKSWYAIRPSGTEPKIKLYLYSVGKDQEDSEKKLATFERIVVEKMESVQ